MTVNGHHTNGVNGANGTNGHVNGSNGTHDTKTVKEIVPFVKPQVNFASAQRLKGCIHSLPELVDFNSLNNQHHTFCVQAKSSEPFDTITHGEFKVAVSKCAAWLKENLPIRPSSDDKALTKMAPVALFMESDIGLVIHEFALMSIGVPVSDHS